MAAFLLLAASPLLGAGADGYTAYKMAAPPQLDGKTDDQAWAKIPWAYGFRSLADSKYEFCAKQTAFKIGYDQDFLYLLARCCEPEMAKLKTGERGYDGWPTILDDLCLLYSDSEREGAVIRLEIGAGDIQRALGPQGPLPSPPEWRTSYRADDRNWYLETAVPLKLLGADPAKGGFFNVVRHLRTVDGSESQRTSQWSSVADPKTGGPSLCPLRFGPSGAAPMHEVVANPYPWWLGGKLSMIKDRGGEYAEAKARLPNSPNWPLAEAARQKCAAARKALTDGGGVGSGTDAYLDWLHAVGQMAETSAPIRLELRSRDATARLFLNGQELRPESGWFQFLLGRGRRV